MKIKTDHIAAVVFVIVIMAVTGCATNKEAAKKEAEAAKVYSGRYPRTVAVLPFSNDTEEIGISGQIRKSFFNHFSSKPFDTLKLQPVDEKIARLEKTTGKTVLDIPPKDISDSLGADGLIYGRVTGFTKVYAVAYSQMGAEAEVWLVDAKTGTEVWRYKEAVRYHEGGVSLTPMGMVMTAVSTALNIRDMQQIRVVNELGWKLNEKIPVPPGLKYEEVPVIKNVISNAKESPLGKGKTVKVAMEGDKNLIAMFDIGGFKKAVPMKEVTPGEYLGEYFIVPGDNIKEAPVAAYLRKPTGEEAQWLDISGFLTIKTTPPPQTSDLKGRAFVDRIELSWAAVNIPDLKGYNVYRSKKPLSDYAQTGFTEDPRFTDRSIEPKEEYYYRVTAVDTAGNESERSEYVKTGLREKEIVELPSVIDKDTSLNSGLYLVKGPAGTTVASGVTLVIAPDTRIFFEKGAALKVRGTIHAEGEKDLWIEFLPKNSEETSAGLFIEGYGSRIKYARVRGAASAVTVLNSDPVISDSIIEYNGTGISAGGVPSPVVTGSTIWNNSVGVRLQDSKAVLEKNSVMKNKTGISSVSSSPQITENNIYGNDVNAEIEDSAVPLDGNYLGTLNADEMRLTGTATIAKALDAPYPDGKLQGVFVNPYSILSADERKAKLAELLQQAGKYFRERNFGKAASTFEETLKIEQGPVTYYYLGLSYQGMDDNGKALLYLKNGTEKFPMDSTLIKAYGMLLYQLDKQDEAKAALKEALRLNPGDKQIKFILERLEAK